MVYFIRLLYDIPFRFGIRSADALHSTPGSLKLSTPGSTQLTLADCHVQSIGNSYSCPTFESKGLSPVIILRDPFDVFCEQVRDAHEYDIKLKAAAESLDPWANCPVKFADFAKNCSENCSAPWRYIASLWMVIACPDLNLNPKYV